MLVRTSWIAAFVASAVVPFPVVAGPTKAPTTRPSVQSVEGRWTPLSRVFDNFGLMTVEQKKVRWESGQSARIEVVGEDGRGVLLRLIPPPTLHNSKYTAVRLLRRARDPGMGGGQELEVSFYESNKAAEENRVEMWGVYLPTKD